MTHSPALTLARDTLDYFRSLNAPGSKDYETASAALAAIDSELAASADAGKLADMEARKDAAYLERNQVVAALAKCFPSGVARTAIQGWSEDWHGCVYINLPTGQASWHFHDSQAYLFDGLPAYTGAWDGHDTPEKYRRLAALARTAPATMATEAVSAQGDERAAFEAWVTESGAVNAAHGLPPLKRDLDTGGYWFSATNAAWLAWQAARAQVAAARRAITRAAAAAIGSAIESGETPK